MWATFFLVASVTGLRPGELLALRWTDWYRSLIISRTIDDGGLVKEKLKEHRQDEGKIKPAGRNLVPYSLRHGFDTDLLKRAPMYIVQTLMGHSTDKMTRLYNHPNPEDWLI